MLEYCKEFNVPLVVDAKGDSALHLAALFGHRGCVDALLNHGVDPNARNAAAEPPLHGAAKWGFTSVVQALLRSEMNIELNHPPNLERLVLGCIDADFC